MRYTFCREVVETEMELQEAVLQRRSVKQFTEGVEIEPKVWRHWLELASKAPSSWNLQHAAYGVITSQRDKERLLPIAYQQKQVLTASLVVVLLGDLQANRIAAEVMKPAVDAGSMPAEIAKRLQEQIEQAYQSGAVAHSEALINASLTGMQLMLLAKDAGYDSCPMGGFDHAKLQAEFAIPERYLPVMLVAIGKRAAEPTATYRLDIDQRIIPLH